MDYTPIIDGDRYCLMCRHVCPVERVTKREATSPHGWALLIASVRRGLLAWDADTVDTLYQCADCGLCQANCATDRPLPAAIVAARAAVVAQDAHPTSVRDLDIRLRQSDFGFSILDFRLGNSFRGKCSLIENYKKRTFIQNLKSKISLVFDKNSFLHIDNQFANVFDVIADAFEIFRRE